LDGRGEETQGNRRRIRRRERKRRRRWRRRWWGGEESREGNIGIVVKSTSFDAISISDRIPIMKTPLSISITRSDRGNHMRYRGEEGERKGSKGRRTKTPRKEELPSEANVVARVPRDELSNT